MLRKESILGHLDFLIFSHRGEWNLCRSNTAACEPRHRIDNLRKSLKRKGLSSLIARQGRSSGLAVRNFRGTRQRRYFGRGRSLGKEAPHLGRREA
jgi:hypothetical protein